MKNGRVLVVDDDREIVKAIAILLEQECRRWTYLRGSRFSLC